MGTQIFHLVTMKLFLALFLAFAVVTVCHAHEKKAVKGTIGPILRMEQVFEGDDKTELVKRHQNNNVSHPDKSRCNACPAGTRMCLSCPTTSDPLRVGCFSSRFAHVCCGCGATSCSAVKKENLVPEPPVLTQLPSLSLAS